MSKITLLLMSEKGLSVLREVLSSFDPEIIDFIVIGSDKNVVKDYSEEIQNLAQKHKIRTFKRNAIYQIKSKYAIAISWRWLINYENEQTRLIVFHDSLLPKYRGFAPLVNQLIQKEPILGVTAFLANEAFDKGAIIKQLKTNISYPIKIEEAIRKVTPLYNDLANSIIGRIVNNLELNIVAQSEEQATYSLWRDDRDYEINWSEHAEDIQRFINAVGFPYLGASTHIGDRTIRILDAKVEQDLCIVNRDHGKTLFSEENHVVVVCGKGLLKITQAVYDDTKESIFPLQKFRLRFL